jgi:hypothetical protein
MSGLSSSSFHLLLVAGLVSPKPCTVIDLKVVRVESGHVRGTTVSYWDPDCACRARTEFEEHSRTIASPARSGPEERPLRISSSRVTGWLNASTPRE